MVTRRPGTGGVLFNLAFPQWADVVFRLKLSSCCVYYSYHTYSTLPNIY